MSRLDIPTLQCDRCKTTTQDIGEMGKYIALTGTWNEYQGTKQKWDLCPACWVAFRQWVDTKTVERKQQ